MPQRQLEQFVGKGHERLWWLVTYRHAAGGVVGGFIGNKAGQLVGSGGVTWLLTLLGVVVGLWLVWSVRGQMRGMRLILVGWFYARSAVGTPMVDSQRWYATTTAEAIPLLEVSLDGQTAITVDGGGP